MITEEEILEVGYTKSDLSNDESNVYYIIYSRSDKPSRTQNYFRLEWDLSDDIFHLDTNLERLQDFDMSTIAYVGTLETKEELEDLTNSFKIRNEKI